MHKKLGENIRSLREERGLSQTQVGAPYLTRAAVSRIELGQSAPSLKVLVHIARQLKVTVRDLFPPDF